MQSISPSDSGSNAAAQPPGGAALAREVGFAQCVSALRRTLATTPVGWALVLWFCWGKVPQHLIFIWLGLTAAFWCANLAILNRVVRAGSQLHLHTRPLLLSASLDGLGWGLIAVFLMGHNPILDALLVAVLCGITAINSQVYITYLRGFYVQEGVLWIVCTAGLMRLVDQPGALDYAVGYSVYIGLMIYYMIPVTRRLLEGIGLQLANASLAEQLRVALSVERRDASTDALTGQGNRRALDALLGHQMDVAGRTGETFSLLMLDIDFFKQINDEYGHKVGDDALRAFALRVREYLRQGDVCVRYGGEEFVVVLPGATLEKALEVAERVRQGVAQVPLLETPELRATVSIGAARLEPGQSLEDLLHAADAAMYAAKRGGRNQVQS
jgi:diguanylate cyclase (GGDEF)-like protein